MNSVASHQFATTTAAYAATRVALWFFPALFVTHLAYFGLHHGLRCVGLRRRGLLRGRGRRDIEPLMWRSEPTAR